MGSTVVEELQVLIKQHGAKEVTAAMKGVEKQGDKTENSMLRLAASYVSVGAALYGAKGLIRLYADQERAERRLAAVAGSHTAALIKQAQALQKVTIYGDEQIIQAQVLLRNMGVTNDKMELATKATTELAAAFGWDLTQAARNAGKTMGGFAGELGEVIPALKALTKEELQQGKGLELLIKLYGGQAAAETDTLYGSMQQAKNAAGDLGETIGGLLAPSVTKAAKAVTALIGELQRMNQFDWLALIQSVSGQSVLAKGSSRQAAVMRTLEATRKEILGRNAPATGGAGSAAPMAAKLGAKGRGGSSPDDLALALAGGNDWGGSDEALAAWRDLEYGKLAIDEEAQAARTELWFQSNIDRLDNDRWLAEEQVAIAAAAAEEAARQWDQQFGQQWKQMAQGMGQVWGQLWVDIISDQKNAQKHLLAGILGTMGDWAISEGSVMLLAALAEAVPTKGASLAGIGPSLALIAAGGLLKGGQALTQGYASGGTYGSGGAYAQTPGGGSNQAGSNRTVIVNLYSLEPQDPGAVGKRIKGYLDAADEEGA